jgi:hypothetical protein
MKKKLRKFDENKPALEAMKRKIESIGGNAK